MKKVKILKSIGLVVALSIVAGSIYYLNFGRYQKSVSVSSKIDSAHTYSEEEVEALLVEASNDAKTEYKNQIQNTLSEGKSALEVLRELFNDEIVVTSEDKYLFVPILNNVEKHNYNLAGFSANENGEIQYKDEKNRISKKGIDVSKYQGEINWELVKEDGVTFAYIRLGYRGYQSGVLALDECFIKNIEEATKAGIEVGIYFFSQAIDEKEAVEEANFVINSLKDHKLTYPIVFDTEEIIGDRSRTQTLTVEERTNNCLAFFKTIEEAGYEPMIYANLKCYTTMLDLTKLEGYDKWLAQYEAVPYFPYAFKIWQYSESGKVNGIDGNVDLNIILE